jgi:hypothetical protein
MPDIDEASVLKRAKELCEQDGYVWELTFKTEPNRPQRLASDKLRQEYLLRARAQLRKDHFSGTVWSAPPL